MKKLLCIGLLCLVGCQSPEQTEEQFQQNIQRLDQIIKALKDSGTEAKVFARIRLDKVGSWETSLKGPGELDVFIAGEVEPEEVTDVVVLEPVIE